jgi:uncharacterized membrane-anchored protein
MMLRSATLFAALLVMTSAHAEVKSATDAEAQASKLQWHEGPLAIDLGHDLDIDLPEGYVFLHKEGAAQLLAKMGNFHHDNLLGLLASKRQQEEYYVVIQYDESGYVKDDDEIDASDLLSTFRDGLETINQERADHGFDPLAIDGWAEPPHYDRRAHHLVWALLVSSKSVGQSVNYNTRILGRRGVVSLNLVTESGRLAADKTHAARLLAATRFREGARYEDFDPRKDKISEFGLIGLMLGSFGVAKVIKLGLLAKFWKIFLALLIAGKKALIVALVGIGAFFKRVLGNKAANAKPPRTT